ncbi:MAG: DUF1266 domain-containing protein [Treponema sp.]|nr:DUF1266 domain-containing protein [Treponema sp.]
MKQKVRTLFLFAFFLQVCFPILSLEYESYACAFSSNFIEIYKLSHLEFDPAVDSKQMQRLCVQLLKSSFQVSSSKDISKAAENIKTKGANESFQESIKLFEENKNKSTLDIIKSLYMDVGESSNLFFAETIKDKMRIKDLSAWDNGRLIELYRCAVGAGYINKEDAVSAIKPAVDFLVKTYENWDDYFAHYFIGKQFTMLHEGKYSSSFELCLKAYTITKGKINYGKIPLKKTSTEISKSNIILDLAYTPSPSGRQWESVQELASSKKVLNNRDLTAVKNLKKKFPNVPCIEFMEISILFRQKAYRKTLNLCYNLEETTNNSPKDSPLYQQIQLTYAKAALKVSKPAIAEKALSKLPESVFSTAEYLETEGRLYMELYGTSSSYDKNEEYKKLAEKSFTAAEKAGFKLPQDIKNWLRSNGIRS